MRTGRRKPASARTRAATRRMSAEPPNTPGNGSGAAGMPSSPAFSRTTRVLRPTVMTVPGPATTSRTRAPPTNVPFFDPQSST